MASYSQPSVVNIKVYKETQRVRVRKWEKVIKKEWLQIVTAFHSQTKTHSGVSNNPFNKICNDSSIIVTNNTTKKALPTLKRP